MCPSEQSPVIITLTPVTVAATRARNSAGVNHTCCIRHPVGHVVMIVWRNHHGNASPLLCQKDPVFSRFNFSMRAAKPAAASDGSIMPPKLTIRVLT